ncbi:hypothetical protein Bhyg_05263 [Pseudolycoriella hygida]|uniref:Uncharacterized protein n=1 Tax=Pseudolycoriella hygida TaxID=35572 RepID=A0A9Q0SAL9_9DIPT|nr:hypothetical protein Bhyg_05263 [Pseudolycoriella hygida]
MSMILPWNVAIMEYCVELYEEEARLPAFQSRSRN